MESKYNFFVNLNLETNFFSEKITITENSTPKKQQKICSLKPSKFEQTQIVKYRIPVKIIMLAKNNPEYFKTFLTNTVSHPFCVLLTVYHISLLKATQNSRLRKTGVFK